MADENAFVKRGRIELNPGLLAASTCHGVGNVTLCDHFSYFLSLVYIFLFELIFIG